MLKAEKMYHVNKIGATNELAKATGCSKKALAKIINKGAGAYYSSGSRPNQTAQSWGVARLASSITAGKAAAVDYKILEEGCKPKSKALTLAKRAKRKHGRGTRRVPKVKM
jgi:DNA-binding Xre family transcriptional regulator